MAVSEFRSESLFSVWLMAAPPRCTFAPCAPRAMTVVFALLICAIYAHARPCAHQAAPRLGSGHSAGMSALLPSDRVITCMGKGCGWPVAMCSNDGFVHKGPAACVNPGGPHRQLLCAHCGRFVNRRNFLRLGHDKPHRPHSHGRCVTVHAWMCGAVSVCHSCAPLLVCDPLHCPPAAHRASSSGQVRVISRTLSPLS